MHNTRYFIAPMAILPVVPLLALTLSLLPVEAEAEVIDRVVAEVNEDVITLSEVEEEGKAMFRKIALEVPPENRDQAFFQVRQDVLNSLIDKRLIAQEAAKQGVTVSEEEVDLAMQQVLEANDLDKETFEQQLRANGISYAAYRSNLKSQLYQNKLVSRDIRSKIVITDEMMLDYYDNYYTRKVREGSYYLLQIGISWGETEAATSSTAALYEDKQAARKRAQRVHKLARSGADFRELARKFSDLPSASEGGDIGVFAADEMASYMREAVSSLEPGEVSAIIETPVGFQFFKLLSSKEGGIVMQAPYETVKEEIRERLFRESLQEEYEQWIKEIREQAYIRVL